MLCPKGGAPILLVSAAARSILNMVVDMVSLRAVLTGTTLIALTACGGGGSNSSSPPPSAASGPPSGIELQVVSFGDSLSDEGTYAPIAAPFGGGKFTTNPGKIWLDDVAAYYGSGQSPAYTIDYTQKLSYQGGMAYAEGGATVNTPANQSSFLYDVIGDVEMPVTQQVSSYLSHHGSFSPGELVFVWAGSNDVLRAGPIATGGPIVEQAATILAQTIAKIIANGAVHVVVIGVPNVGISPKGRTSSDGGATYTQESQLFNSTLNQELQTLGIAGDVIQIDSYTWLTNLVANYKANGFTVSNTAQACDPNKTPDDTALLCSTATYIISNADDVYMFADDLHLSTHTNRLFASYVEQQIAATGLGH